MQDSDAKGISGYSAVVQIERESVTRERRPLVTAEVAATETHYQRLVFFMMADVEVG